MGDQPLVFPDGSTDGKFVDLDGERYYRISHYDLMPDFFMSIVSASDQWMFISSNGSLTAGRKNARSALFPYYPEDKIHDFQGVTGSSTIILADQGGRLVMWEPFSKGCPHLYTISRNLYKNLQGSRLIFEEINQELSLCFRYGWSSAKAHIGPSVGPTIMAQGIGYGLIVGGAYGYVGWGLWQIAHGR